MLVFIIGRTIHPKSVTGFIGLLKEGQERLPTIAGSNIDIIEADFAMKDGAINCDFGRIEYVLPGPCYGDNRMFFSGQTPKRLN